MTIRIHKGWGEELLIETQNGTAKVHVTGDELKIENEAILKEIGMTVSDALALFFDKAANSSTRAQFQNYLGYRGK